MKSRSGRRRILLAAWIAPAVGLILPAMGAEARHTSSIVLTHDEKTVCAVNQDSGSVSLWNFSGDGGSREIKVGDEPRTLAVSPDDRRLYVTNQRSQTLSVIDIASAEVVATIELGGQPYGVLVTSDGRRAFVSQYAGGYVDTTYCGGMVSVVDLTNHVPIRQIVVGPRPWAMALRPDERSLYVTHYLHVDGKGIVTEIDPQDCTVRREIRFEEDEDVVGGRGGVFNALAGIALHPNGRRALVVGMHANVRRGLANSGRPLSHKTTVQAAIRVLDLEEGHELPEARMVSSFSGQAVAVPAAVAFIGPSNVDDAGEHFIDLYFASNDLKVLKYNEKGYVAERALLELPAGPTGVVVTRDGQTAFVTSRWDRSISQLSIADVRQPRVVKTVHTAAEPWDQQTIGGAILFHNSRDTRMTANRWISCAVCHLDGGLVSDSMVWDLTVQDGPAKVSNTMDLVITSGTSPPFFHRGTPDVVGALEQFVHTFHRGSGFSEGSGVGGRGSGVRVQDSGFRFRAFAESPEARTLNPEPAEEWAAMLAYINSLRPRPSPHMDMDQDLPRAEIREAARRGRTLFFDRRVGCARCHKGAYLTRSGTDERPRLYDVGTGLRADVPSLLHLWDTAPYLHDGRAGTLREVVTTYNPHDKHGKTGQLRNEEIDDLIAFLLAPFFRLEQ